MPMVSLAVMVAAARTPRRRGSAPASSVFAKHSEFGIYANSLRQFAKLTKMPTQIAKLLDKNFAKKQEWQT